MPTPQSPEEPTPEEIARGLNEQANEAGITDNGAPAPNGQRPQIKLPTLGREYADFAREIGQILSDKAVLFRRDQFAFTINSELQRLDAMDPQRFRTWISDHIEFYVEKTVHEVSLRRAKTMTIDHAGAVLASPQFLKQLPQIRRLHFARQPVFRLDRSLVLLRSGFFGEQGIYTLKDNVAMDETMTIEEARENILDFFKEYPMDDRSKAVVLASCLQMFCSALLKKGARPPSFLITANAPGAGKTILAMLPVILTMGTAAARGLPRGEELRKVLDILVIRAANYVIFDNIKSKIEADDLEAFLTTIMWQARPLGQSVEILLENNVTVFFTGNQSSWSLDMGERCLIAHLEVVEADIGDRRFSRNIDVPFIVENRGKLLSSLWAFVRYWDAAGRPVPADLLPMQRFGAWSELVAPIVIHAGFANPLVRPKIKDTEDEIDDMCELVTRIISDEEHDGRLWTFDELIEVVKQFGLFSSLFTARRRGTEAFDKDGKITPAGRSNFGKLFTRYDNRVFVIEASRFRFIVSGRGNTRRFSIEPIEGV